MDIHVDYNFGFVSVLVTRNVLRILDIVVRIAQMIYNFKTWNIFYILDGLPLKKVRSVKKNYENFNETENPTSV
jgi:hypothetical protein